MSMSRRPWPWPTREEALREYDIALVPRARLETLDAVVLAIPHRELSPLALELVHAGANILVDVMWGVDPAEVPDGVRYWRL